jgi:transcriptional regulator with XRE-family HTH domain
MTLSSQATPTTKRPHFATLLVMALDPAEVGARIKKAREERGWTHDQLRDAYAEFTGKKRPGLRTVQRWQTGVNPANGKTWLPRLGTLMELADLFEKPRSYFVEEADLEVPTRQLVEELVASREEMAALRRDLAAYESRRVRRGRGGPQSTSA